jgi:phospholipid transport system substrate-binding protein
MEISVRQRALTDVTYFWFAVLVLLAAGITVNAEQNSPKDANNPNELWWSRYDAVVKDPNNAHELLEAKCRAVLTVLQHKELDQKLKEKIIDKIMTPIFDFPLMAKLALGKENWLKLTEQQHEKFTRLFVERLKNSYLEKITLYRDEKVLFKPAVEKKNTVQIPMMVISDGKDIAILYKLRRMDEKPKDKTSERWKIYDVEVQGVSILMTYRSQFDDIMHRGGVNELLSQLEKLPTQ